MLDLTKESRYTKKTVRGLLKNRPALSELRYSELGTDMIPILDFEMALDNVKLTDKERIVLDVYFNETEFTDYRYSDVEELTGIPERNVRELANSIVSKVTAEINRGLYV